MCISLILVFPACRAVPGMPQKLHSYLCLFSIIGSWRWYSKRTCGWMTALSVLSSLKRFKIMSHEGQRGVGQKKQKRKRRHSRQRKQRDPGKTQPISSLTRLEHRVRRWGNNKARWDFTSLAFKVLVQMSCPQKVILDQLAFKIAPSAFHLLLSILLPCLFFVASIRIWNTCYPLKVLYYWQHRITDNHHHSWHQYHNHQIGSMKQGSFLSYFVTTQPVLTIRPGTSGNRLFVLFIYSINIYWTYTC